MVFAVQQIEDAGSELAFEPVVVGDPSGTQTADEAELVTSHVAAAAAVVLTTAALDALDALQMPAASQPDISAQDQAPQTQPTLDAIDLDIGPITADAADVQPVDLPQVAEDVVLVDSFTFDDDLQAIFAMYDSFVPPSSEDGMIVIAPLPPEDGPAFLQVITLGPDEKWYTDSSLTTPYDGDLGDQPIAIDPEIMPPPEGCAFLQVITQGPDGRWYTDSSLTTPFDGVVGDQPIVMDPELMPPQDGGAFLQVILQGPDGRWYTDSSLTTPFEDEGFLPPIAICPVIDWDGSCYLPEPGTDVLLG